MKTRDTLRTAVLVSNPYWPFKALNKIAYTIAIRAFARMCADYPCIKSVYLRSGLVEHQWVPGLSDIDFTIVLDRTQPTGNLLSFLREFWRRFDKLKRCLPMLGEVDILGQNHIASWTRFGLAGHSARHWKLVYGQATAEISQPFDADCFTQDCIDYALNYFFWYCDGYFERKFYGKTEPSYLLDRDLRRLASKTLRCLDRIPTTQKPKDRSLEYWAEPHLLAQVVTELTRQISMAPGVGNRDPQDSSWIAEFECERQNARSHQGIIDAAIFTPWREVIESVLLDYNKRMYIVLRDDLEHPAMTRCISELRERLASTGAIVTITTRTVFSYVLRHHQPLEYFYLSRYREQIFGVDLVALLAPPSKSAYERALVGQVPNVIAFPYSRHFHTTAGLDELGSMLERGLFVCHYLEHRAIAAAPAKFLGMCERRYPDSVQQLREYREKKVDHEPDRRFKTFKELADRTCAALKNVGQ